MIKPIKIKDNNEPLVDIKKYCPGIKTRIDKKRIKTEKTAYLRKMVAKMLRQAQKYLPKGYNFIINDAWRPAYVQCEIYFNFIKKFSGKYPKWPKGRIIKEVNKYVAPWKGKNVSGHMSGGAVDLRIIDKYGCKLPMKSRKLNYQQNALFDQKLLPPYLQKNRKIMANAMIRAGFSNYPKEFWHWSYGDYYWAKRNQKKTAIYGLTADWKNLYNNKFCPCGARRADGKPIKFKDCHGK